THLNDAVLAMPVFADGELVAWTANIAHWSDVGGMAPGSISTDAREIFQEGLRLPAVKLIDEGKPLEPVLAIVEANSRLPDSLRGDLWAGIAAVRVGERRLLELVAKYGAGTFAEALRVSFDRGERAARRALAELPNGKFGLEEEQDSGALYRVTLELGLGERLPAGHFASICGTFIGGRHPDTGRHFTIVEPQVGGWGGSARRDGNNAMFSGIHGHTFNCPAEVAEARYGLFVDRLALSD